MARAAHFLCLLFWMAVLSCTGAQASGLGRANLLLGQQTELGRMGKSVCFLLAGADPALLSQAAIDSSHRFMRALDALQLGDATRGLGAEEDDRTLAALARLQTRSRPVIRAARQIVAGDLHRVPMSMLLDGGAAVERDLAALGDAVLPRYLDGASGNAAHANMKTLAGQSARLQGLLRDACLLKVGLLGKRGQARMRASLAAFDTDLAALRKGDPGRRIVPPPTVQARVLLDRVAGFWAKARPIVATAIGGDEVDMRALQKASILADLIDRSFASASAQYQARPAERQRTGTE